MVKTASNAGGQASIPGQGTINRSHMLPLRVHRPQLKTAHATTKIEDPVSQLRPGAAK